MAGLICLVGAAATLSSCDSKVRLRVKVRIADGGTTTSSVATP